MFEQLPNLWWVLVLLGFVGGIVSGALGVGSGVVFVPMLAMVFLLSQKAAQGTALAVMVPMALLGALRYWRNPDIEVNLNMVALLAVGSVAGVLLGTEIAYHVSGHWLRKAFAVLMVVVAVRMFTMGPRSPDAAAGISSLPQTSVTTAKGENDD